jgi:hypothetical protein
MALEKKEHCHRIRIMFDANGNIELVEMTRRVTILDDGKAVGPAQEAARTVSVPAVERLVEELHAAIDREIEADDVRRQEAEQQLKEKLATEKAGHAEQKRNEMAEAERRARIAAERLHGVLPKKAE